MFKRRGNLMPVWVMSTDPTCNPLQLLLEKLSATTWQMEKNRHDDTIWC